MGAIRFFSCGTARRFLSGLVAGVFLFSTASANVGAAFAATPDVATTGSASAGAVPAASQAASPTVVREIEESRTPVSNTYLLSDGTYRQEIYEKPVNYKPSGETTLQPIDTSLVPSAAFGVSQTKASGFPETFASGDETATPVSVAGDGWRVGMRMVGGNLDDPLALGQSANYPFAAPATQLTYTAKSDGFEDTLTLSDPSAPDTFVFYMALDNLSIFQNPSGGWALRDGKNGQIVGNLGEYRVFDSSGTDPLAPGAQCPSATMDVRAVPGGAYITYHVPREWLDDPARAYPVKVDPTLYFYYPNAGSNDTFIAKGNPYNYYGSSTDMYVGDWSTKGNYCRSMLWYSMGSIPQGVTVTGATLSLYCCSSNAGGSTTVNVGRLKNGFAWTSTWAQIMGSASNSDINIMAQPWTYKSQAAGNNVWWTFDVKSLVQSWFDGSATNYGFAVVRAGGRQKRLGQPRRLVSMNDAAGNALVTYGFDTAKGWRSWQKAASDTAATTFGYSDSGRLTSFSKPAGALGDPASVVATYGYDASGQRVRSTVTSGTGGSAVSTATAFTYDGLTLLSLASARTAGGASSTWSIAYLYSETGRPYAGVYRAGTATPTVFGMVVTDRGDVVALTDAAGNPFAAYRYDAWGRPLSVSTQSVSDSIAATLAADIAARQPLRYAGYVWDAESQTYNLSARTYDPATMQFLQKDPAKADGEASAYQYCGGDPVGKVDPSGNWEILARYRIYPGNVGGWNRNLSYRGFAGWVAAEIGPAIAEEILGRVIPVSKVRTLFGLTTNGASMVSLGKAMQTSWGQFKEYDTVYLERSSWAYPSQDLHMKAWGYFHFVMMRWFVTRWHSSRTMSVMLYPKYVSGMYRHNGRSVRVTPHDFATRVRKGLVL